jgi:hypothetical protein
MKSARKDPGDLGSIGAAAAAADVVVVLGTRLRQQPRMVAGIERGGGGVADPDDVDARADDAGVGAAAAAVAVAGQIPAGGTAGAAVADSPGAGCRV